MIKSKKQSLIVIGVFTLVLLLGSVTYAFFNYTRIGNPNNFSVGRINFISRQTETISLTNLFPIDPTETGIMNDDTKVGTYSIDIIGDTDYVDGLEYLVSIVDSNIPVPISVDVSVSSGLGTSNDNYFTTRESKNASIYKRLMGNTINGDGMLLVGYIKPNTTSGVIEGVDGTMTITAYLDKNKILISDTYDGTESDNMGTPNSMAQGKTVITTADWNALSTNGLSFKIKVEANEGIWVHESLEMIMKRNAVMDNISSTFVSASTGIDFGTSSSDTNGKGVYMRAGTENNANPITYYRGDITDNNVLFNNMCWKAVRTTDTGGVKLIYSGEYGPMYTNEYEDVDTYLSENVGDTFIYDSTDDTWNYDVDDGKKHEISLKFPAGDNYKLVITGTTVSDCSGTSVGIIKDGSWITGRGFGNGQPIDITYSLGTLTSSNIIEVEIDGRYTSSTCKANVKISMQQNSTKISKNDYSVLTKKNTGELGCNNTGIDTHINLSGTNMFAFNTSYNSPAYVGYMYGNIYTIKQDSILSGIYFGRGFTYENGEYILTDPVTSIDANHHYSCHLPTSDGTCAIIRYYYNYHDYGAYGDSGYYVELTGGDSIESGFAKMNTNTNDSIVKTQIDSWYSNNMVSVTNKLEDEIWCNDRSFGSGNNNGWISNGGDLVTNLSYGATERGNNASSSSILKNQPSLVCVNKNDAFTVNDTNRGNGALTYPVALLTADEFVLAGGISSSSQNQFYLASDTGYWIMSPSNFDFNYGGSIYALYDSHLTGMSIDLLLGIRPAISIKAGRPVINGDGTPTNPYVVD